MSSAGTGARSWRGLPGGSVGLAGSRHSTLRDKIRALPDFVERAMDMSMGRAAVTPPPKRTATPPPGPYDFVGGEAALKAKEEAIALERKLSGDIASESSGSAEKKVARVGGSKTKVKLSVSASAEGLARCLAGHSEYQKRLRRVEEICGGVSAPRLGKHIIQALGGRGGTDKDGSSRRNRMMGGTPAHLVDNRQKLSRAKTRANAKKRWGKVRNVVRGTLGLAAAAAAMRGGLDEASKLSDGVSTSVEKVSAGSAAALHNHERSDATNKLRPRRSPRGCRSAITGLRRCSAACATLRTR